MKDSWDNSNQSNINQSYEIAGVVLTAAGKFIFMDWLNVKLAFVVIATTCWVLYIIYRERKSPGSLRHWGFRVDNLKKAVLGLLPYGIIAMTASLLVGYFRHTLNPTWHIIPILILYPVWGTIQQFIIISLVGGNLAEMKTVPRTVSVSLVAILFAIVHYPDYWLMAGTFLLALFYGFYFLKIRNVFALGIFHGWLGAIFYYSVVGKDPFLEAFEKYGRQ